MRANRVTFMSHLAELGVLAQFLGVLAQFLGVLAQFLGVLA